jgi:hypothetical protein
MQFAGPAKCIGASQQRAPLQDHKALKSWMRLPGYCAADRFFPACMKASTLDLSIRSEPVSTKAGMGA